jgi:valyl-tRNA synthetase
MNLEGFAVADSAAAAAGRTAADRWILARTQRAANETIAALEAFRFNDAAGTVYQFVWGDLCDWYIELAKEAFNGDDLGRKRAAQATLVEALSVALRLLHPFMPFITEELWHVLRDRVRADGWADSILAAPYPAPGPVDEPAERAFGPIIGIVDAIRNVRGEMNVPYKVVLEDVEIGSLAAEAEATVREELGRVHRIANARGAVVRPAGVAPSRRGGSAVQVGAGFEVRVGLAGAVDVAAETGRITKEIEKVDQDLALLEKKLSNPSFVERAPAEVVEKDRARVAELREKRSKLDAHRVMLADTETVTARRHTVENQTNEQKPQDTIATQAQEAAGQVQTAVAGAVEKVVETAQEIAKAASTAVSAQIDRLRKPAKRKAAKKAAKKAPAKKAAKKAAKKSPARAAKKASKKTAKRPAKKAAKKAAKRGARR